MNILNYYIVNLTIHYSLKILSYIGYEGWINTKKKQSTLKDGTKNVKKIYTSKYCLCLFDLKIKNMEEVVRH